MWAVVTPGRSRAVRSDHRRWSPAMTVSSGGPLEGQVVRRRRLSGRGAQERLDEAVVVVRIRGAVGAARREVELGVGANLCRRGVRSSASRNEADVTAARSDAWSSGGTYGYFSASTCW